MNKPNDLTRSLVPFGQNTTMIVVIELSLSGWLVAGMVPGIERRPLKKVEPDANGLLQLIHRWREQAIRNGRDIRRIALAYEAGRDGFWLARWLQARGIEVHVIHPTRVTVSREHKRAKTDRLDTALLMRVFLGWLRSESGHCRMVAVPTLAEEDAKRPSREHESLAAEATRIINRLKAALVRLGIRDFNPKPSNAQNMLETLRSPEGEPIPPNTLREMNHGFAMFKPSSTSWVASVVAIDQPRRDG